ncbi:hypothetical protein ACN077_19920 [Clostridium chromiireducens]|uniref:hypothetical protein n=1 Tax=Clostridium chromiireducens TaxID=225345 RepID=UPI003AF5451D
MFIINKIGIKSIKITRNQYNEMPKNPLNAIRIRSSFIIFSLFDVILRMNQKRITAKSVLTAPN